MEPCRRISVLIPDQPDRQITTWMDEKFFVSRQKPKRKMDGEWAQGNPQKILKRSIVAIKIT